ncbi:nitroreductase/quinone reductase family protein [Mycobacterium sp. 852002-51971_SCH5477799-a]|uniref:nitroreductase/quinone reductase family protein n=1 Tax=Mycobacterium sp. 852002-51971_SCH5477799-a TaxID=1834106 RepID=UPI000B03A274|nr:nitroreductase/quinone reductase family protein [Mycobacterium sp. 852002-51971_SCH5477799-a]
MFRRHRPTALSADPNYPRLWQIVSKNNQNRYNGYQKKTSRPIAIVDMVPKGGTAR